MIFVHELNVSLGVITLASGCVLVALRELYYFACAVEHGIGLIGGFDEFKAPGFAELSDDFASDRIGSVSFIERIDVDLVYVLKSLCAFRGAQKPAENQHGREEAELH